jgi:hypothetical protein
MDTATQEQQAPMAAEPQKEHQWLQRLVGEWTVEGEATMGPDEPVQKFGGTETVRPIGSTWIVAQGDGDMCGDGPAVTLMTLGFDPAKERFVGTWIGSMMNHLWVYNGTMDESGTVLTLESEGPTPTGAMATFRDVIEVKGDDHRVLTGFMPAEDGGWHQIMRAEYRRVK